MTKDSDFWNKLELDKGRVERIITSLEEYTDKAFKYPGKAVSELSKSLEDFTLREIAFALIHLNIANTRNRRKGDVAARLLIDDDNIELVDNVLAFFESADTIMYSRDDEDEDEDDDE